MARRLVLWGWFLVFGLMTTLMVHGAFTDRDALRESTAIVTRGVDSQAAVTGVSFDPGDGGPNGWTSLRVTFQLPDGQTVRQTVGHEGEPTESVGSQVTIRYDPQDPSAVAYGPIDLVEAQDNIAGDPELVGVFAVTALAPTGVLAVRWVVMALRRRRVGRP
jgi:hypothetical protein